MTGKINVNGNNSESWGKISTRHVDSGVIHTVTLLVKVNIYMLVRNVLFIHVRYCSLVICKVVLDCNWVSPYQLPLHMKDFIEIYVKASIKLMGPC